MQRCCLSKCLLDDQSGQVLVILLGGCYLLNYITMLMKYIIDGAGLSYDTNETILKDAFGQHGEIIEGDVVGSINL